MTNALTFECSRIYGGAACLTPCIDGQRLTNSVAAFEAEQGYDDPAGGYGGIIPAYIRLGPLRSYLLGQEEPVSDEASEIYVLFCDCGEAGCWPLVARVTCTEDEVTLGIAFVSRIGQSGITPALAHSSFAGAAYEAAIAEAIEFAGEDAES